MNPSNGNVSFQQATPTDLYKPPVPPPRIQVDMNRIPQPKRNYGSVEKILKCMSFIAFILLLPFSLCWALIIVSEFQRVVMFRLGYLQPGPAKGPGVVFYLPCIDSYRTVDLRTMSFDVPTQEILTKDSVTVAVDAVVYYRVREPIDAVIKIEHYQQSTWLLAQTTLRNELGKRDLSQLLSDREAISHQMQMTLDEATDPWGIEVSRIEIKDVRLPFQLQKAMAAEAEAMREARAKIIVAEGEIKASKSLKEASQVIVDNPVALQLRYLQTLNNISTASTNNSTIVFPFPMEMLKAFLDTRTSSHQ